MIDVLKSREEFRNVGDEQPGLAPCNKGGDDENVFMRRTTKRECGIHFPCRKCGSIRVLCNGFIGDLVLARTKTWDCSYSQRIKFNGEKRKGLIKFL